MSTALPLNPWQLLQARPAPRPWSDALAAVLAGLAGLASTMDSAPPVAEDVAPMDQADRADIQATLSGDGDAYERLVRRHQQAVASRMRRFTRERGALEELVHDVFVQAFLALPRFRGDAPFEHYLAVIATRTGYQFWKRRSAARPTVPLTGAEPADDSSDPADGLPALDGVLDQLGPRDRLVLTLLYLDGHSVAEAARLTGWSQPMVKVQAFRARGKLKRIMVTQGLHP